jgi:hypothetical protein
MEFFPGIPAESWAEMILWGIAAEPVVSGQIRGRRGGVFF